MLEEQIYILGLDQSTTGTYAVLFRSKKGSKSPAEVLASARKSHQQITP